MLFLADHDATASGVVGDGVHNLPHAAVVAEINDLEGGCHVVNGRRHSLERGIENIALEHKCDFGFD